MKVTVIIDGSSRTGARGGEVVFDTSDPATRYHYGTTPEEIARSVAADYCDSGSVSFVVGSSRPKLVLARP